MSEETDGFGPVSAAFDRAIAAPDIAAEGGELTCHSMTQIGRLSRSMR
jgi:hypothetical protein